MREGARELARNASEAQRTIGVARLTNLPSEKARCDSDRSE
jgi:hypothetical protein